jgi:hypothetical protein
MAFYQNARFDVDGLQAAHLAKQMAACATRHYCAWPCDLQGLQGGNGGGAPMITLDYDLLAFIRDYAAANGYPPDIRAMEYKFNRARSIIHYHLGKLESNGLMTRKRYTARTWRLTAAGEALAEELERRVQNVR